MNIVYIISVIILLVILYALQKHARYLLSQWHEVTDASAKFIFIFALITAAFAILCWLFLFYWTFSSWQTSLDPSKPKPYFLIMYVLGLFSIGILMGLSQFFSGLNKLKKEIVNESEKTD